MPTSAPSTCTEAQHHAPAFTLKPGMYDLGRAQSGETGEMQAVPVYSNRG